MHAALRDVSPSTAPSQETAPFAPAPPAEVQVEALLEQVAGDLDILAAVAEVFVECRHDQLLALEWAVQAGNAPAIATAAHTLSGSLRNLCASPAAALAAGIEEAAREGRGRGHDARVAELGPRLRAIEAELLALVAQGGRTRGDR